MTRLSQSVRGRQVVLDLFDEAILSFALQDLVEGVQFECNRRVSKPDEYVKTELLGLVDKPFMSRILVPFWSDVHGKERHLHVSFVHPHWVFGGRGSERWMCNIPTITEEMISTSWDRDDPDEKRTADRVWRRMERVVTNRYLLPPGEDPATNKKAFRPASLWAGHHVLEWCQSKERNMLAGYMWPSEKWRAPDTEWHRQMRAKVIARFGPDYGKPPTEPPRLADGSLDPAAFSG